MHAEALGFVRRSLAGGVRGLRVLEIGSLNVNGTPRSLCDGCAEYVGIDRVSGRGVDQVCDAADYDGGHRFDVVICCEVLEHTPNPALVTVAAWQALRPGGLLILTAAGPERAPHGCDGGPVRSGEHYRGVDSAALRRLLRGWREVHIEAYPSRGDVYARAVRP